jgi:SSS family solute:Na+ symporter
MLTNALVFGIPLATVVGALLVVRYLQASGGGGLEEWAVGGRRFGAVIFWFVNAGEIYTTFALLGITGYAWAYGAPAYISLASVSLSFAIGYLLMPRIWIAGKENGFLTQADFFAHRYGSRALGVAVAIAGIAALLMYVQIQMTALTLVLRLTLPEGPGPLEAVAFASAMMIAFVFFAGLRSAAIAASVKDVLMLVLVIALGFTVADRVGASSMLEVFERVELAHPGIGDFPGRASEAGLTVTWFITASLSVAIGTWVFPHMFQLCFSAKDVDAVRRNAIWQPLYSLSYFFIILIGFAALLAGTQPPDGNLNGVLLQFVVDRYPAWMIGLLGGTVILLALVPGSILLLASASIFSRNVLGVLRPGLGSDGALWASRAAVVGFALVAAWLTLDNDSSLVAIGLQAYSAVGMLAPGVILGLAWARTSAAGIVAGMIAGYSVLLVPAARAGVESALPGWDIGFVAMTVNAAVVVAVSGMTRSGPRL